MYNKDMLKIDRENLSSRIDARGSSDILADLSPIGDILTYIEQHLYLDMPYTST